MTPPSLKILFIVHNTTFKGGAYYRAQGLAKPLAKMGHDVTIMPISPKNHFRWGHQVKDGVKLLESPDLMWGIGRSGFDPWDTLCRSWKLFQADYDIVHTIDTRPAVSFPAWVLQKSGRAKWVADWTDWWGKGGAAYERSFGLATKILAPLEEFFEEKPRPLADATVFISKALGERALGLGVKSDHLLYLPPGADPDAIRYTSVAEARAQVMPDFQGPLVGYLGNIYQRDADLLFSALEHTAPETKLLMIGQAKYTIPESVKHRVVKSGFVTFDAMLSHLCACNVLAMPLTDSVANRGRWPSKLNEYVAVGRPTVSCGVGDITELFAEYPIGAICQPTGADMGRQLQHLLENPALATQMGDAARDLAIGDYSQQATADKLLAFYRQVIG